MKKGTVFILSLAVTALLFLASLLLFMTTRKQIDSFISEMMVQEVETEEETKAAASTAVKPIPETEVSQKETTAKPEKKETDTAPSAESKAKYIWVGDSRTLGMRDALDNHDVYIGASGEGYDWLSETGLPLLDKAIQKNPNLPVIFNFGVNDYSNMENYLALYQQLIAKYPDTHFYFLSINPIEPTQCDNITNEEISDFNNHLKKLFPDQYIDSFTFLMINGAVTIDGIHYSEDDYQSIYNFASNQVDFKEGV